MKRAFSFSILFAITCLPLDVNGDDWLQWRGPNRTGISSEQGLLQSWPENGPPLKWHTTDLGEGYASVVVSNGLIHTIGNESGEIYAYGIDDTSGEIKWKTQVGASSRHAMSTPTVDGEYLYALDPDGKLHCLNAKDGSKIWRIDFINSFDGKLQSGRGYGESPLIDGDHLICTPGGSDAMIVALNKESGDIVWKTPAPNLGSKGGDGASFSSIVKSSGGGIEQYVQLIGRGLVGVAADDGRFLWGYNDISADIVNIPTPIISEDYVFSANGYNAGSVLLHLKPNDKQGIDATEVYRLPGNTFQNHHGGVIKLGELIIGGHGSNNGLPTAVHMETGKVAWKRRGPGTGSAAVIYADNRFIFRYQNGVVALLETNASGFAVKGTFQIHGAGGDSWSHPAIANKRLYLREQRQLFVYDLAKVDKVAASSRPDNFKFPNSLTPGTKQSLELYEVTHNSLANRTNSKNNNKDLVFYSYLYDGPDIESTLATPFINLRPKEKGLFDTKTLDLLANIKTPFVIDLSNTAFSEEMIRQLKDLPALRGLDLEFSRGLSNSVIDAVAQLQQLRVLHLGGSDITDQTIQQIVNLEQLQSLDLEGCEQISDLALPHIAKLTELRFLNLKKTAFEKLKVTDSGLVALSQLSELEYLNLYGNRISDPGMAEVAKLTKLEFLDLSLVGITDAGVQSLAPLTNLRSLHLLYNTGFAGPKISDKCMPTIKTFTKLNHLNLVGASVSSKSVDTFTDLKRLSRLEIQYSGFNSADIEKITEILPNTLITK